MANIITKPYTVATNRNLIDDWYFCGDGSAADVFPINQRGQASYSGNVFAIDRWKGGNSRTTITPTANGLQISANDTNYGQAIQTISLPANQFDGKTVTLSALLGNNMIIKGTAKLELTSTPTTAITVATPDSNGMISLQVSTSEINVLLRAQTSKTITIKAVKLEFGDCQTLAHYVQDGASFYFEVNEIPNYQQELAKCQRYFTRIKNIAGTYNRIGIANAYSSTVAMALIPLPVTMRPATPTVSYNQIHLQNGTTTVAANGVAFRGLSVNAAYFDIGASGLSAGAMYLVKGDYGNSITNDGYIDISCEL